MQLELQGVSLSVQLYGCSVSPMSQQLQLPELLPSLGLSLPEPEKESGL